MKACIIQPPYSRDTSFSDEYFQFKMNMLEACDDSIDIIVLPEYSDVPCATQTKEETFYYHKKYINILLDKCIETAKRCNSLVFVNALYDIGGNYRNTTYCYNREGELVGQYFKKHLPPLELETLALDSDYTFEPSEPYVIEIEGLRFGFLTCYDFYFYEAFANIARQNVDIIIGCSLQRSDSHDAIEIMCRFLAYNTNAYVLRSSVSFSEDSDICGASMVVSPYGKVLANMKGRFGMETVEFDPKDKYFKPAGFGNPPAAHYEYIEYGRKPWQYRIGGSAIVKPEKYMQYPRICVMGETENAMVTYGAAVALDAQEIGINLCSNEDCTKFEKILQKFAGQAIMNIHVKPTADDKEFFEKIISLVKKYDCEGYVYFTLENGEQIKQLGTGIPVALKACNGIDDAIELGCQKVQLCKECCSEENIEKAHKHGIKCSIFCCDEAEAKRYIDMGVDTILTNNYNLVNEGKYAL